MRSTEDHAGSDDAAAGGMPDAWVASSSLVAEVRAAALEHLRRRWSKLDPADHEDLAQEAAIAVNAAVARGDLIRTPAAWATTVASRRASNLVRSRTRLMPEQDDELAPRAAVERFVVSAASVSAIAMAREQMARLVAAIDERELQMLWLADAGHSHAEIGELLGLKADSVKKALTRMRAHVRGDAEALGLDDAPEDHPRVY
jgi:RNA polymerase sigma factor (sigma-70 family)